ncbi:hypothetical protein RFI_34258 [Reticulomyxa filosa]|uniref:Uncharacterized protein n=1 Tax=Reticulomyxa filosa TaxID=46433 RepID=X6LPR9_RETFI|nr:hypothetical protein RFI_34258 [Reticulomyxa filosa]|eukprot:ETO03152.1 hypothetical protein RFI_34258 [Reticulomyxa filosa]
MILTVLSSLMKQHSIGTKISKSQVYEAFNEQQIDIHVKNLSKKIKLAFQQYYQDLRFEIKSANEKADMKMDEKRTTLRYNDKNQNMIEKM